MQTGNNSDRAPTISIITPVYNVEKYIRRCLTSINNQTFNDFEVILVDDGSTDNSGAICDQWAKADERFTVIHQKNSGAGAARNAGLKIARGKYIGFVDSDDWIDPQMYKVLIEALENNAECDIADCNIKRVSNYYLNSSSDIDSLKYIYKNIEDVWLDFFRVNGEDSNYSICTKLIKNEILKDFSFVEGTISEDVMASYDFYTRSKGLVKIPIPLYYYFQNKEGVTRKAVSKKDLEYINAFRRIYEDIYNKYPEMSEYAYINYIRANYTILSKMKLAGYDKDDEDLKKEYIKLKGIVRRNFWKLLLWKMPLSRKILLIYDCI